MCVRLAFWSKFTMLYLFILLLALLRTPIIASLDNIEQDPSKLTCDGKDYDVNIRPESKCLNSFYGCYDELRPKIFTQATRTISCGFQMSTGFDAAIARTSALDCQTVIYTATFGAMSILHLPNNTLPQGSVHPKYGTLCRVLLIDAASAPKVPADTAAAHGWHVIPVDDPLPYESTGKSYKVAKLLGAAFFPRAERYLFFDAPILWRVSPLHIFDMMDGKPLAMFRHRRVGRRTHSELITARSRMMKAAKLENVATVIDALKAQKDAYAGYESKGMLVGHVIARDRTVEPGCVRLFECAWFGELHTFSYRDQPSVYYTLDNLGLTHHMKVLSNNCSDSILVHRGAKFTEPIFLNRPYQPLLEHQQSVCYPPKGVELW